MFNAILMILFLIGVFVLCWGFLGLISPKLMFQKTRQQVLRLMLAGFGGAGLAVVLKSIDNEVNTVSDGVKQTAEIEGIVNKAVAEALAKKEAQAKAEQEAQALAKQEAKADSLNGDDKSKEKDFGITPEEAFKRFNGFVGELTQSDVIDLTLQYNPKREKGKVDNVGEVINYKMQVDWMNLIVVTAPAGNVKELILSITASEVDEQELVARTLVAFYGVVAMTDPTLTLAEAKQLSDDEFVPALKKDAGEATHFERKGVRFSLVYGELTGIIFIAQPTEEDQ